MCIYIYWLECGHGRKYKFRRANVEHQHDEKEPNLYRTDKMPGRGTGTPKRLPSVPQKATMTVASRFFVAFASRSWPA